jgi:hypothetical protein
MKELDIPANRMEERYTVGYVVFVLLISRNPIHERTISLRFRWA